MDFFVDFLFLCVCICQFFVVLLQSKTIRLCLNKFFISLLLSRSRRKWPWRNICTPVFLRLQPTAQSVLTLHANLFVIPRRRFMLASRGIACRTLVSSVAIWWSSIARFRPLMATMWRRISTASLRSRSFVPTHPAGALGLFPTTMLIVPFAWMRTMPLLSGASSHIPSIPSAVNHVRPRRLQQFLRQL